MGKKNKKGKKSKSDFMPLEPLTLMFWELAGLLENVPAGKLPKRKRVEAVFNRVCKKFDSNKFKKLLSKMSESDSVDLNAFGDGLNEQLRETLEKFLDVIEDEGGREAESEEVPASRSETNAD